MIKLSVVIVAFNEEKDIERCLNSAQDVADEILVVDSLSTDSTPDICKSYGVNFISHPWEGYVNQKNYALKKAKFDYILSLDADEALSEEMHKAVLEIKMDWKYDGYIFNRRNKYCGKWMEFTTLYPDRKLRLFDRRKGRWTGYDPHDHVVMDEGSTSRKINADIMHWAMEDMEEQKRKTRNFAEVAAKAYAAEGRNPWAGQGIVHAAWRFIREFFLRFGFMEGRQGFWFASSSARYTYLKYKWVKNYRDERANPA